MKTKKDLTKKERFILMTQHIKFLDKAHKEGVYNFDKATKLLLKALKKQQMNNARFAQGKTFFASDIEKRLSQS